MKNTFLISLFVCKYSFFPDKRQRILLKSSLASFHSGVTCEIMQVSAGCPGFEMKDLWDLGKAFISDFQFVRDTIKEGTVLWKVVSHETLDEEDINNLFDVILSECKGGAAITEAEKIREKITAKEKVTKKDAINLIEAVASELPEGSALTALRNIVTKTINNCFNDELTYDNPWANYVSIKANRIPGLKDGRCRKNYKQLCNCRGFQGWGRLEKEYLWEYVPAASGLFKGFWRKTKNYSLRCQVYGSDTPETTCSKCRECVIAACQGLDIPNQGRRLDLFKHDFLDTNSENNQSQWVHLSSNLSSFSEV